jgi:phenylalanyl-tRNA synthetase beta chain
VDVYYPKEERKPIFFFPQEIGRLAGIKVEVDKVKDILSSLEIPFEEDKEALRVYPPPWRKDLNLPCDLVEEVCRIQGYDSIPALSLSSPIPHHKFHPLIDLKEKVKDILISCGMQEVITYSLVSEEKLLRFPSPFWPHQKPLRVKNPLTSDQEYLRTSILPSLLSTLNFNQRQGANRINLFEVGRVYLPRKDKLPCEKEFVAGIMWGRRFPFSWLSPEESFDFFDAKGIVERLMENLAVEAEFTRSDEQNILGAKIAVQEDMIGILGEIHPRIRNNFDLLPGAVWAFEIDLVRLLTHLKVRKFSPLPRFPSAIRDLSFLLSREIPAGKVKDIIVNSSSLVSEVTLFDVYTGEGIPKDRKSLSFRIVYQSSSHTLNDGEIKEVENSIIHRLEKEVGAILRGSEG